MPIGLALLLCGLVWTLGLLGLAAFRFLKLRASLTDVWPWPVWVAISSPFAAALLPLFGGMLFVTITRTESSLLGWVMFGPLVLAGLAGILGVLRGMPK